MIFVYKRQLHFRMVLTLGKTLTSRLETSLLKLNILNLIGFVSYYATVGSSNLTSVGKHDFTERLYKLEHINEFDTFV